MCIHTAVLGLPQLLPAAAHPKFTEGLVLRRCASLRMDGWTDGWIWTEQLIDFENKAFVIQTVHTKSNRQQLQLLNMS